MRIYTLGTSNRKDYEYTKLLNKYNIQIIFDVRRFPVSQFPHFSRENLQKLCMSQKAEYIYLGNDLGGYRDGGYKEYIQSEEFKRGVNIIRNTAEKRVSCILCAERFPMHCHRRFISDELAKAGFEVIHIIDENATQKPEDIRETRKDRPRRFNSRFRRGERKSGPRKNF
jgi:uncharacterized protein (DUF488 family)